MSAKVLTKGPAKEAKIELIETGRGTQAVHEQRGDARGAAFRHANPRTKRKSISPAQNRAAKGRPRACRTRLRPSGGVAVWFRTQTALIYQENFEVDPALAFKRR